MQSARAAKQTAGVYTLANREMKSSDLDFLELAFSTRSSIFETVEAPNSFVVLTFKTPLMFIEPEMIPSPALMLLGRLSPVRALVSREEEPSTTTPSRGTFSPGWTTIMEPISTSSGSTFTSFPSSSIFA